MQVPPPILGSVGEFSCFSFFAQFFNRICSYHNDAEKPICRMCDSLPMDSDHSHNSFSVALPKRENPFATEELVPLPQPTSAIRPESSYDKHLEAYLPPKSHARPPSSAKVRLFLLIFILFYICLCLLFRRLLLHATKKTPPLHERDPFIPQGTRSWTPPPPAQPSPVVASETVPAESSTVEGFLLCEGQFQARRHSFILFF